MFVYLHMLQMFGMVVVFGLFNGLFFLPVLLSLVGPGSSSYHPENSFDANSSSPSKNGQGESALPNSVSPTAEQIPRLENMCNRGSADL